GDGVRRGLAVRAHRRDPAGRAREGLRLHGGRRPRARRGRGVRRKDGHRGRSEGSRHDEPDREDPRNPAVKLLIVRLSAMGAVTHTLPVAANARAAGATVGWVIERGFAGVLQGNADVDSLFVADTQAWRRRPFAAETLLEARALRDRLRAFAPDRV